MPPGSDISGLVRTCALQGGDRLFEELLASVRFEDVGKGRRGAVLVAADGAGAVPIVRTTTGYRTPAHHFRPVHARLARLIQTTAALPVGFNNALIETYSNAYTTMASHSDQALDLADDSFIAIFSCYEHPVAGPPRVLLVESKESAGDQIEVPLTHHSAVVFSAATNRRLRHRIVLPAAGKSRANLWLGVTFRTSKTFVSYRDHAARFQDGTPLTLATDVQRQEFYTMRRRENHEVDFAYPRVTYTLSESDLLPPEPVEDVYSPIARQP